MTKKPLLKIIILAFAIVVISILCTVAIIGAEENKTYTVTYYSNGSVAKTLTFKNGEKHMVLTEPLATTNQSKQFFGWYDDNGQFYGRIQLTVDRDYNLYEAYGVNVKTTDDLLKYLSQAGTFIRLGTSIGLTEKVTLPLVTAVFDVTLLPSTFILSIAASSVDAFLIVKVYSTESHG